MIFVIWSFGGVNNLSFASRLVTLTSFEMIHWQQEIYVSSEISFRNNVHHLRYPPNSRPSKGYKRADRTTMLLVAVLLLFLITEFPQGILGLLSGILEKCFFTRCYNSFGEMMDLLALINAAVGFVLYGLMSKQFRTSFKSVFFNTRLSRLEMTRVTGLNTTCVWPLEWRRLAWLNCIMQGGDDDAEVDAIDV